MLLTPKVKNGFLNLKIEGYLAYTPWDTPLLALVGGGVDGPVFCVANTMSDTLRRAIRALCEYPPLGPRRFLHDARREYGKCCTVG